MEAPLERQACLCFARRVSAPLRFVPCASLLPHPSHSPGACKESVTKFLSEIGSAFSVTCAKEKHARLWLLWNGETYEVKSEINVALKLNSSSIFLPVALNKDWGKQWIISSITVYKEERHSFQVCALDLALYKGRKQNADSGTRKPFSRGPQGPRDLAMFNFGAQNSFKGNSADDDKLFALGGLICH